MNRQFTFIILISIIISGYCIEKYQKDDQETADDLPAINLRTLDKPFRMAKLNLLFIKAQHRLSEKKLRRIFRELKLHDKEEMELKKKKNENEDPDGLLEAEVRKKLIGIMSTYDLLDHYDHIHDRDNYIRHMPLNDPDRAPSAIFSDKKLNHLWNQAEHAGFTPEELDMLREEFAHHQDKIDQYHALFAHVDKNAPTPLEYPTSTDVDLLKVDDEMDMDRLNEGLLIKEYNKVLYKKSDILRHKHKDLLEGFRALESKASKGPLNREFSDPKVEALWQTALHGNFTHSELDSLKLELKHYNKRITHLNKLQYERNVLEKLHREKNPGKRSREVINLDQTIVDHASKVMELHKLLENKIESRHNEL